MIHPSIQAMLILIAVAFGLVIYGKMRNGKEGTFLEKKLESKYVVECGYPVYKKDKVTGKLNKFYRNQ